MTVSHFGQCIGGSWCDDHRIRPNSHFDVIVPEVSPCPGGQLIDGWIFTEGRDGEWRNKFCGTSGQDGLYLGSGADEQPDQRKGFVRSNTPADPDYYFFIFKIC